MKYKMKVTEVDAVLWTGTNRDEVRAFMAPFLLKYENGQDLGPYFSADEESGEKYDDYNTVQFYWGDDIEVYPGCWIVFTEDLGSPPNEPDWDVSVECDALFRLQFEVPSAHD